MERLLIVGNPLPFHIGSYLEKAAQNIAFEVRLCDTRQAFADSPWLNRLSWHFLGKRPYYLRTFSSYVVQQCEQFRPKWILVTGIAPINAESLQAIGTMGIQRLNYLTDDPWNRAHQATWFLQSLYHYDHIFSPRRAPIADLQNHSAAQVHYLPFGYAPHMHFIPPTIHTSRDSTLPDVLFVGGGDHDRVALFTEAVRLGLHPTLHGGYWSRYPAFRAYDHGHIGPDILREKTAISVNLCLVRRANRDGHAMRSFEIPACGGCMLAEDTQEHRAIFGEDGDAVFYFNSPLEMVAKAQELLSDKILRSRLSLAGYDLITSGNHTYQDRLIQIMEISNAV